MCAKHFQTYFGWKRKVLFLNSMEKEKRNCKINFQFVMVNMSEVEGMIASGGAARQQAVH